MAKADRILCTHISVGRSTRYMIMDANRLILVSPELIRPGFATVKYLCYLRSVSGIRIDKDDERIMHVHLANGRDELIGFEDLKRAKLALTMLEPRRMEIRKTIFHNIRKFLIGMM